MAAALEALRDKRAEFQGHAEALAREGLTQKVSGEPEAGLMRTARHGHRAAYNAQTAVDAKHGLIAAFDLVGDCNDQCQVLPMAPQGRAELEAENLVVVVDTGYSTGEHAEACEEACITAAVPRPKIVNTKDGAHFSRDAFTFDAESDSWTCPVQFQPDIVKIDMHLIRGINTDPASRAILRHMLRLLDELANTPLCEGVDTKNELEALRDPGVTLIQGYVLAKRAVESLVTQARFERRIPQAA